MNTLSNDGQMLIGELAERLGLTTRTLRYWEQRTLIPAASRTPKGYRLYGRRHLEAARGIGRLKQAGLGLDDIRELQGCLGAQPTARADLGRLGAILDRRIQQVGRSIEEQQQLLTELIYSRDLLRSCNGCDGKPYDRECVGCLELSSTSAMPDTLLSVLEGCSRSDRSDQRRSER